MSKSQSRSIFSLMTLLVMSWASPVWAWNDLGHIIVARIAYSRLSGEERQAIAKILKHHPHYDLYFKKPEGLDVPEDEWLFLRAATWCDYVRPPRGLDRDQIHTHPIHKFHRGPWHYVNFPFQPGQDTTRLPTALVPTDPEKTDILEQLQLTHGVLTGKVHKDSGHAKGVTAAQNRAVRMCWLFHLIGDLHQPLHATAWVDRDLFPGPNHGDNGGNLILIRPHATSSPTNLHSFWDNLPGFASGWKRLDRIDKLHADVKQARDKSDLLTHNPAYAIEQLTEIARHRRYVDWAFESYQFAASTTYDHGNLKFITQKQLDANQLGRNAVPLLPALLQEKARAVANRRLTVAGYRLAEQIQEIVHP